MPMKLAQPTFLTGPSDKLATVDVYTQQSNSVINNRPDAWSIGKLGNATSLLGGKGMLSSLPLGNPKALVQAGMDNLTGRLGITNPKIAKAVQSLSKLAVNEISKHIPMDKINKITASVGSVERLVDAATSGNAMGVIGAVNNLAQNAGIPGIALSDRHGLVALGSGIMKTGIENNIPGCLTVLKGCGVIPDNKAMNAIVKNAIPAIIKKGDLGTLKEITMIAPSSTVSLNDNTLTEFCKYYPDASAPKTPGQYQSEFGDIQNSFQTINADWLKSKADVEGDSVNLSSIMSASPEFKKTIAVGALNSDNPDDKWLLAASSRSDAEFKLLSEGSTLDGYTDAQIKAMGGMLPANQPDANFKLLQEGSTLDGYTNAQIQAMGGMLPANSSKNASTPVQRAETLYPAAASMGNTTAAPVDPRVVAEKQRVDAIQKKIDTFSLPSRTVEQLTMEMEQENTRWTERLREEVDPLYQAAKTAKLAGDTALADAKTAEARVAETSMRTYFEKRIARVKADLAKWDEFEALKRSRG